MQNNALALWRVLYYTRATLRVAVKHPPNKLTEPRTKGQLTAERLNARLILLFGGSEGIRPTSLSAVSVVKQNATLFRLPETVANDGKGQRSIRKRLDCLCQTFSCATPCRAVFGGSVSNVNRIIVTQH